MFGGLLVVGVAVVVAVVVVVVVVVVLLLLLMAVDLVASTMQLPDVSVLVSWV